MKKTLFALALLLATGGAFAQVGIKADAIQKAQRAKLDKASAQMMKSQKQTTVRNGAKDGENLTLLCDFFDETAYQFGKTAVNTVTGNSAFHLQPNTNTAFGTEGAALNQFLGIVENGVVDWWFFERFARYFTVPGTQDNGFAYISMLDLEQDGQNTRTLDATVTMTQPIETFGMRGLDIYFNQTLQRFNQDRYFIDWSNDATFASYDSIEFNVRGMEMGANDADWGTKRVTLPKGSSNANSVATSEDEMVYIRFRVYSPANADQPHGYWLTLDDIHYAEVPEDRVEVINANYVFNAYHVIPEGVKLDTLLYVATVENTGGTDYLDAKVENVINSVASEDGETFIYTEVARNSSEPDTLVNEVTDVYVLDDAGNVTDTLAQRYREMEASTAALPYQEQGLYCASTIITSGSEIVSAVDDSTYFNVAGPMVFPEGHYQWAKDRNRLVERGCFTYGHVVVGGNTYLTDRAAFGLAGYEVCLPYGSADDNESVRYITGVEVVPSMDSCLAGAQIQGVLRMVNPAATTVDDWVITVEDNWGNPVQSPVYTVATSDLNNGLATDPDYLDVIGPDAFNTIYLEFPNSVRLEPGETYYACYRMAATGRFSVGTDNPGIGTFGAGGNTSTSLYYAGSMLIFEPNINSPYGWGGQFYWPLYTDGVTPMIRMILGTEASLPEDIALTSSMELYPNPAANSAKLNYSLNKSGNVMVTVTDIMGRTVKTINQGAQVAGTAYQLDLNTSDMANGTYFYTISLNGEKQTKKFVVNR